MRTHPDKFLPFVAIFPKCTQYSKLWLQQYPRLLKVLEDLLKSGTSYCATQSSRLLQKIPKSIEEKSKLFVSINKVFL